MLEITEYGPWALVIGGSEGVGAAFARYLAADGFKLVAVARKPAPLEDIAAELREQGAEVRIVSADLSRPDVLTTVRAHAIVPREKTAEAAQATRKLADS